METKILTDAGGKKIEVQQPAPSDTLDLLEVGGNRGRAWFQYAMWIFAARKVDGVILPRPLTDRLMKANADRLGHEGLAAIQEWANPVPPEGDDIADVPSNTATSTIETAKN